MLTLVFSDSTYIALTFIMTHTVSPRFWCVSGPKILAYSLDFCLLVYLFLQVDSGACLFLTCLLLNCFLNRSSSWKIDSRTAAAQREQAVNPLLADRLKSCLAKPVYLDSSSPYGPVGDHESILYPVKDSVTKPGPWPPILPPARAEDHLGKCLFLLVVIDSLKEWIHRRHLLSPAFRWVSLLLRLMEGPARILVFNYFSECLTFFSYEFYIIFS